MHGYAGLGAGPTITFGTPEWSACMKQEIASKKAGGPYNPSRCTPLLKGGSGGVPLAYYMVGAGALVAGAAWYFFFRKPKPG